MFSTARQAGNIFAQPAVKLLVGGGAAAAVLVPLSAWLTSQPTFAPADVGAVVVAALLMLGGVMTFLPTLDRRTLARALEPEAGDRAALSDADIRFLRLQGLTMVVAGMLTVAPAVLADLPELGNLAYGGLIVVLGLHTLLNVAAWRGSDSFDRRVMIETAAMSFWVLQGALLLWAGAERMGLVSGLTAWTALVVVMAFSLLAGGWAAVRRTGA